MWSLSLTYAQCPHFKSENNNTYYMGLSLGLKKVMHTGSLQQCLPQSKQMVCLHTILASTILTVLLHELPPNTYVAAHNHRRLYFQHQCLLLTSVWTKYVCGIHTHSRQTHIHINKNKYKNKYK